MGQEIEGDTKIIDEKNIPTSLVKTLKAVFYGGFIIYSTGALFALKNIDDKMTEVYGLRAEREQAIEMAKISRGVASNYFLGEADSLQAEINSRAANMPSLEKEVWKSWYYFLK